MGSFVPPLIQEGQRGVTSELDISLDPFSTSSTKPGQRSLGMTKEGSPLLHRRS